MESETLKKSAETLLIMVIGIFIVIIVLEYAVLGFFKGPGSDRIKETFTMFKSIENLILMTAVLVDVILWIGFFWKKENEKEEMAEQILNKVQKRRGGGEYMSDSEWESVSNKQNLNRQKYQKRFNKKRDYI